MEIKEKIGVSIKTYRKNAKLSQVELASKIGGTHAAVRFWENGINIPNVEDCWKIAGALGLSIDEVVGRI